MRQEVLLKQITQAVGTDLACTGRICDATVEIVRADIQDELSSEWYIRRSMHFSSGELWLLQGPSVAPLALSEDVHGV